MKKVILTGLLLASITSCYTRIGDLSLVANKNYQKKENYELLQQNVEAKCKIKKGNALESAIDKAVESIPGGNHLENVKIYTSGAKIKVIGDVYGIRPAATTTTAE